MDERTCSERDRCLSLSMSDISAVSLPQQRILCSLEYSASTLLRCLLCLTDVAGMSLNVSLADFLVAVDTPPKAAEFVDGIIESLSIIDVVDFLCALTFAAQYVVRVSACAGDESNRFHRHCKSRCAQRGDVGRQECFHC